MSLVWEHYCGGGGELLTALALADHAHDDGAGIRPSVAYTAKKTRQSERTVQMHLAQMRHIRWLLTVGGAHGGRGRATEYRINPAWILNPEEFALFSETPKTVKFEDQKGEIWREKGCKSFAPQPPRTIIESSAVVVAPVDKSAVDLDLRWPDIFAVRDRTRADEILSECPWLLRQDVLDEMAGLASRSSVRHPIGLLRALVARARSGQFVASAALDFRKKHGLQDAQLLDPPEERTDGDPAFDASPRHLARARLSIQRAELAAMVGIDGAATWLKQK